MMYYIETDVTYVFNTFPFMVWFKIAVRCHCLVLMITNATIIILSKNGFLITKMDQTQPK